MSANFDALLKPPRAQSYAVMVMMTVVSRRELHGKKNIQEQGIGVKRSDRLSTLSFKRIPGRDTLRETQRPPHTIRAPIVHSGETRCTLKSGPICSFSRFPWLRKSSAQSSFIFSL